MEVLHKFGELGVAGLAFHESMFMGHQDTMFLDVFIHLGNHYVLYNLGADAGEEDGPAVFCFAFAAFLEHGGNIGGFPVSWAVTLIIQQNECKDGGNGGTGGL